MTTTVNLQNKEIELELDQRMSQYGLNPCGK